jgi:ribosome-associated translation inhibitor RaiA
MALKTLLDTGDVALPATEHRRIMRHLEALDRRLVHHPDPSADVVIKRHPTRRQFDVDLRVQLGPHGQHLISHQIGVTAAHAVRLAVEDVERQLERKHAMQRGEPSFGVPSRRLPEHLRPHPPAGDQAPSPDETERR